MANNSHTKRLAPVRERLVPKAGTTKRLLYTRKQVAELLGGVNPAYIAFLEREGRLTGVRFTRASSARCYYRANDVQRLVDELEAASILNT